VPFIRRKARVCAEVYKHLNVISVSERNGMDNIYIHRIGGNVYDLKKKRSPAFAVLYLEMTSGENKTERVDGRIGRGEDK